MGRWFFNFSFDGRAPRSHAWANYFAWIGIFIVLFIGFAASGATAGLSGSGGATGGVIVLALLCLVAIVCSFIDHTAMTFRRAHDTGKSGWIWVLLLIPLINLLPLYWLLIEDSQQGPNKYGPAVKQFYVPPDATATV